MRNLRILALVVATGMIVAACSSASTAPSGAKPSAQSSVGPGEGEVDLVIWAGYADHSTTDPNDNWVTQFTTDTGCVVKTQDGTDSANMVQLMQTGQYDGVSASGDATLRLIRGGIVAPVNTDLIPNYANVFPGLKGQPHNTVNGVPYGVPHGRGANLLIYNTDTFKTAPTSWSVVWEANSPAADKISIYNSAIYIADAAVYLMKHKPDLKITNPYELDDAQFTAAVNLLKDQKKIVGEYWSTAAAQIESFASGSMLAGTTWQYQVNQLAGSPVAATLPQEGSTGWSDTWMISKTAKHPNCMYKWMNWIISPVANAKATVSFGEAPVSQAACDEAEKISPGHCATYHATDEEYFKKLFLWSTPSVECGDARGSVCKDFGAWTTAWTDITGS
jgi:putative spermidine/putrescine transport system substrate-binding protein